MGAKNSALYIRCGAQERSDWQAEAERRELSLSAWIRDTLNREVVFRGGEGLRQFIETNKEPAGPLTKEMLEGPKTRNPVSTGPVVIQGKEFRPDFKKGKG